MQDDPNRLEARATKPKAVGRERDVMAIHLFMAIGDPTPDAGYLVMQIGGCCERLGALQAARWRYGRAVEENPSIDRYLDARRRLDHVGIDTLLDEGASA